MTTAMTFEHRLRRIVRKHRQMANGVVGRMGPDGLVIPVARRAMPTFPLRSIVLVIGVALLLKAYLLAAIGGAEFDARVATLSQGSLLDQGGAFVMQADPMTVTVAAWISQIIN